MDSTAYEMTDMADLLVVQHFVNALKTRNKPIGIKDAHSLVSTAPAHKNYLKACYKMDLLDCFFLKYPQYFDLAGGILTLKDPDLEVEEVESARYFQDLLQKRKNRPLHATNAQCFLSSSVVENFLKSKYNLTDLTPFFLKHSNIFSLESGLIKLCHYTETSNYVQRDMKGTSTQPAIVAKAPPPPFPSVSNRQKKAAKNLEHQAVQFYVDLVSRRDEVTTRRAHSFLQDNVDIREHLRSNYGLSELKPFFQAHPDKFCLKGELVLLQNPTQDKKTNPVVTAPVAPEVPKAVFLPKQKTVTPEGTIIYSRRSVSSPGGSSKGVSPSSSTVSLSGGKKKGPSTAESIENQKMLSHLLSLVMKPVPPKGAPADDQIGTGHKVEGTNKFCDVACQTISSGPILSLNVFHEMKRTP